MSGIEPGPGYAVGIGKTTIRGVGFEAGEMVSFESEATPHETMDLFAWVAGRLVIAREAGAEWAVVGFPCPVNTERQIILPTKAAGPLAGEPKPLQATLAKANGAYNELLQEFPDFVEGRNDCDLLAHAAVRFATEDNKSVAAMTLGTGLGAGMVTRGEDGIFRLEPYPFEIGMKKVNWDNAFHDIESLISGPAIEKLTGTPPADLDSDHPHWRTVGILLAQEVVGLRAIVGADLVVISGGVGAGRSDAYRPYMDAYLEKKTYHDRYGFRIVPPRVEIVPAAEAQTFEVTGALGLMKEILNPSTGIEPVTFSDIREVRRRHLAQKN